MYYQTTTIHNKSDYAGGPTHPYFRTEWQPNYHFIFRQPNSNRGFSASCEKDHLACLTSVCSIITIIGGIFEDLSPGFLILGGCFSFLGNCITYVTSSNREIKNLNLRALRYSSLLFELLPGIIMTTIGGVEQRNYTLASGIILLVSASLHLTATSVYLYQKDNQESQENPALLAENKV